jgi:membrane-associated protease RseP (regulator of RpoE activity)
MARAGWLVVGVVLVAATMAGAAGPCEEGRAQSGLALVSGAEGLEVGTVDSDSAAAEAGIVVGDRILQVNGTVPRSCADYARAVREARRDHKALLVLVRRAAADVPLVLAARTWERPVASRGALAPAAEAPNVGSVVAAPPPSPLPPQTKVTVEDVTRGIAELAPADHPPARLDAYRTQLVLLHRQTETLATRQAVPAGVVTGLRTVLRYYDAAGLLWDAEEQRSEREHMPHHRAANGAAPAPYFNDSQVTATLDEFPFLRATVIREPAPGVLGGESAGLWRPYEARALLWQHGRDELARLTTWLAGNVHG